MTNNERERASSGPRGPDELQDFDPASHLTSDEAIAAYMTDIIATGDMALLNSAIDDVVRARGVAKVAEAAGVTREGLYKALRAASKPRFETVAAVLDALGLALCVLPKSGGDAAEYGSSLHPDEPVPSRP